MKLDWLFRKTCWSCQKKYWKEAGKIRFTSKECTDTEPFHEVHLCNSCTKFLEMVKSHDLVK